jgi:hypothetical protein
MATLTIPDQLLHKLETLAKAKAITIAELIEPITKEEPAPLTGAAWLAAFQAWQDAAKARSDRYPADHVLDVSRETMYFERLDAQL